MTCTRYKTIFFWSATVSLNIVEGALAVDFSYDKPTLTHDPNECSGPCPLDVAELHRKYFSMDISALEQVIPKLKHALEQNWDYCAMGIQQVTLRDPVFTRRGDFVCELNLYTGMFCYVSLSGSQNLTLPTDPHPPAMLDHNAWEQHTELVFEHKGTLST